MTKKIEQLSAYELTNLIIDNTKRFMVALEQGVALGQLETIRDEVKQLAERLKQKEVEKNQQQNVENSPQERIGGILNNFHHIN